MSTSWTLPTQAIIKDALELIQAIGVNDHISAEDNDVALKAFQNILKELPLHGLHWPKITVTPVTLAWSIGTPSQVAMPADYFDTPVISYTANSQNIDLVQITKAQYDALPSQTATALYPEMFYVATNNISYLYPVPTANPNLTITYQAIVSDAVLGVMPDIKQTAIATMGLWLAHVLAPKYNVSQQDKQDIATRFAISRRMLLSYAAESAPITFSVRE
jgi:hypothetical protein